MNFPGERFVQLTWGHELYCAGHLIQAAVALHRTRGDARAARRRPSGRRPDRALVRHRAGPVDGICGHPEIETALVELYRETGERAYLDAARYFVDRRGPQAARRPTASARTTSRTTLPVREAPSVEGHSVRQLYLLAGVADLYVEDGDETLREAADRLWHEMVATKTYVTGGIGTHHTDEAFGDPYELTNERSYCETCAAIASVMFSWRMLMITGEARYADLVERTLYNGFLAGLSLDGQALHLRQPAAGPRRPHVRRQRPRLRPQALVQVRLLPAQRDAHAGLARALRRARRRHSGLRVHQFVPGTWTAAGRRRRGDGARCTTDYPWDGRVSASRVDDSPGTWGLTVRVPHWAAAATVTVNGDAVDAEPWPTAG